MTRWGRQDGEGVSATCEYDGSRYRLDHFTYPIGDGWVVLVREACLEDSYEVVRPGFRTVRDSIEPRSPARRLPDVARPATIRAGGVRFDIPGDWQKLVTDGDHAIFVEVDPPQDAYFSMTVYSSELTIGDEADRTIDAYRIPENEVVDGEPFATWGR